MQALFFLIYRNCDISGIQDHLAYVSSLGVSAIHLDSIYVWSDVLGRNVIDHKAIDGRLGTMSDFNSLVDAIHGKGE